MTTDSPLMHFAALAQELALSTTPRQMAELVAHHGAACAGAVFCNLALFDPLDRSLKLFHGPFLAQSLQTKYAAVPLDAPFPIAAAARQKKAVWLASTAEYREHFPEILDDTLTAGVQATASLPLCRADDGSLIGALGFAWDTPMLFNAEWRAELRGVAHLCAGALERALLYDAELELIRALQARLVPTLPQLRGFVTAARYLPATRSLSVGGDWYEAVPRPNGQVDFVVGDVVGHGALAAADMAMARGMISGLMQAGVLLDDLFDHLSSLLGERSDTFLGTAAIVSIDRSRDNLTYATAGHPPPLVRWPDGSIVRLDAANSPMIGVSRRGSTSATIGFPPGSRLVMYTDGLVERPDRPFEHGIAELEALLRGSSHVSPHEFLAQALNALVHDAEATDDVALLIADRVTPDASVHDERS